MKHLIIHLKIKILNLKFLRNMGTSGFSLIEVMIALAIFSFIIGGVVMFSVNSIKANTRSQAMQEAMDNARYAMDDLAKKVRTSSNIVLSGDTALFFIDNKTLSKYCYQFLEGQMLVAKYTPTFNASGDMDAPATYNAINDCGTLGASVDPVSIKSIVGEKSGEGKIKISGKFEVMETNITDDDNPHRGFVRIIIDMVYNEGGTLEDRAEMHLQSGVSLVDYAREEGYTAE